MIYVDPAVFQKPKGRKSYGHMVGSTVLELKAFAESIGVKPHFWHSKGTLSHFDITLEQHQIAIQKGALEVSSKELIAFARIMNNGI